MILQLDQVLQRIAFITGVHRFDISIQLVVFAGGLIRLYHRLD